VAAVLLRDDPWSRLAFLVPLAALASVLSLMGFLQLLTPPPPKPAPAALSVEFLELPAPAPPSETASPQEAAPVPPPPEPAAEPPPEPMPEPAQEPARAAPETPPPPPKPQAPRRQAAAKAATPAAPAQQAAPSAPAPTATATASGGLTGARAIYQPTPEIPESLRHRNVELVATARFQVAANGSARVELIGPTSDQELNRSLLETLQKWRFFPAMEQGKAVASVIDIRIPVSVR
jgi:protein TonB